MGLEKQYEEGYRSLLGVEHSDALAYFAMVAEAERKENERKLEIQSDLFVPHYLRNDFQYFAATDTGNRTIAFADATQLEQIVSEGMKFYKADMGARGDVCGLDQRVGVALSLNGKASKSSQVQTAAVVSLSL